MSDLNQAAFARPYSEDHARTDQEYATAGLTKREYAAIHLKVPMSGNPELDAMIREAVRRDLAVRATAGWMANPTATPVEAGLKDATPMDMATVAATFGFMVADAMLKEEEK